MPYPHRPHLLIWGFSEFFIWKILCAIFVNFLLQRVGKSSPVSMRDLMTMPNSPYTPYTSVVCCCQMNGLWRPLRMVFNLHISVLNVEVFLQRRNLSTKNTFFVTGIGDGSVVPSFQEDVLHNVCVYRSISCKHIDIFEILIKYHHRPADKLSRCKKMRTALELRL